MSLLGGLDGQANISDRLPMPVDAVADTAYVNSISSETVQFYYWASNVWTVDAGQAAGTVVAARLAYTGILDSAGAMIGNSQDTSFAFTTGSILTTLVACPKRHIEDPENATLEEIATDMTSGFSSGQYCIDHRNGVIYGKKATTGTSDTGAYKVLTTSTGGGTGIASSVNVHKVGNTAVSAKNAAASEPPLNTGGEYELIGALVTDAGTAGDKVPWKGSAKGVQYVQTINSDGELGSAPDAYGLDAAGSDSYTTLVTASRDCSHIFISVQGAYDAIVSLDGTNHQFYIPANSAHVFDGVVIQASATVQGKNAGAGENYINLAATIW